MLPTAPGGHFQCGVFHSRIQFDSSSCLLFLSLTSFTFFFRSLSTGLTDDMALVILSPLHCSLTGLPLCIECAMFTPTPGPLHCPSFCQEASKSVPFATQILISASPLPGGPPCPCPSVPRTHCLFPYPISSLTPAWQYLKVFCFSFAFLLVSFTAVECQALTARILSFCDRVLPPPPAPRTFLTSQNIHGHRRQTKVLTPWDVLALPCSLISPLLRLPQGLSAPRPPWV